MLTLFAITCIILIGGRLLTRYNCTLACISMVLTCVSLLLFAVGAAWALNPDATYQEVEMVEVEGVNIDASARYFVKDDRLLQYKVNAKALFVPFCRGDIIEIDIPAGTEISYRVDRPKETIKII